MRGAEEKAKPAAKDGLLRISCTQRFFVASQYLNLSSFCEVANMHLALQLQAKHLNRGTVASLGEALFVHPNGLLHVQLLLLFGDLSILFS